YRPSGHPPALLSFPTRRSSDLALIAVLASGRTPYLAAFAGITGCILVGLLNPYQRIKLRDLYDSFETGAKYALAVGAAAGTVGLDRKSTRLNSSHVKISYAVFC